MRIHLSRADVTEVEEEFVMDALRSGWVAPLGPHVDAFESEIADRVSVEHALALTSGTAALHLALLEMGAAPGKVVVMPSMTFAASANAVLYTGASPVFVDSNPNDGNVDPALLIRTVRELLDEGNDVCAAMTVDLFGRSADYAEIEPVLAELEVPLIEDAAEALGARYEGRPAGSFGRAAALSFNGNKIMTTSGGGMLLSNDENLISHARKLSTQAREPTPWYEHTEVGFNYRMSNILAALGRGQLTRLDAMMARRREIRRLYKESLGDIQGINFIGHSTPRGDEWDNCWLTCVTLDPQYIRPSASDLIVQLNSRDIEARHLWKPMHSQPIFANARTFKTGAADFLFRTGVTLPSGTGLTDSQVIHVAETLRGSLL